MRLWESGYRRGVPEGKRIAVRVGRRLVGAPPSPREKERSLVSYDSLVAF